MTIPRVAILGGGPAGLAAAWQLHRQGKGRAIVLEQCDDVGGNAGSFVLDGLPVDYGSHRLHPSCQPKILNDLESLLGDDLVNRPRHGRIYLRGRWIHFPLKPIDLLFRLPWSFGLAVARDALRKVIPRELPMGSDTFASVLERGLGATICRDFYFPYARKIWGVAPDEISAAQARRRVSAGSLGKMVRRVLSSVPGLRTPGSGRFYYPRNGYGQISQSIAAAARACGAEIRLGTRVKRVVLGKPHHVEEKSNSGSACIEADYVWSTIPVTVLAQIIDPAPVPKIAEAHQRISYRAMVLVYLVVAEPQFTPFDAHYFPGTETALTRLSEPKNYSGRSDPPDRTVLCGEIPCTAGDDLWNLPDGELAEVMRDSLARCGLPIRARILGVATRRLPHAYPIYLRGYEEHFDRLDAWVAGLERILTFGRQGLFAHDNTHHTLEMAYAAVDCLANSGDFDWVRWRQYRAEFETHVVED